MPSQKWLTRHSKYKNIYARVQVLVTVRLDKHEVSGQRRLNAGPPSTTLTHHRTSPKQTPLPDGMRGSGLLNHALKGPFKAYQLSVDDLINLFTHNNDYISITILKILS